MPTTARRPLRRSAGLVRAVVFCCIVWLIVSTRPLSNSPLVGSWSNSPVPDSLSHSVTFHADGTWEAWLIMGSLKHGSGTGKWKLVGDNLRYCHDQPLYLDGVLQEIASGSIPQIMWDVKARALGENWYPTQLRFLTQDRIVWSQGGEETQWSREQ